MVVCGSARARVCVCVRVYVRVRVRVRVCLGARPGQASHEWLACKTTTLDSECSAQLLTGSSLSQTRRCRHCRVARDCVQGFADLCTSKRARATGQAAPTSTLPPWCNPPHAESSQSHRRLGDKSLPGRLELPTLRLTASRSNQLSYGSNCMAQGVAWLMIMIM